MVGRRPELEKLLDGLSRALNGQGYCFGITGPAGVGKSHLLRNLEEVAGDLGFGVFKGAARPGSGPAEVFSSVLSLPDQSQIGPDLPILLTEQLVERAAAGPILLTLEDMHSADAATVSLLIMLARGVVHLPTIIVVTFTIERLDTTYGDVHPLIDGLRILGREGVYEELRLHPLDRDELLRTVEEEVQGTLDRSLAAALWERCEGNPMVALEDIRLLIQSKQVERDVGIWKAVGTIERDLPENYQATIRSRLDLLLPEDLETLTIAAVAGKVFDPVVMAKAEGRTLLDILEQLDRLAHDHQLLEEYDDHYRFSVSGVRDVIMEYLSPSQSREIHGRIARALEGGPEDGESFGQISEHYYRAEVREKCACFSLLAAERYMDTGEFEEALENYQKVLEATTDGTLQEERIFCMERMADAEGAIGAIGPARKRYDLLMKEPLSKDARERISRKAATMHGKDAPEDQT